MSLIKGKTPIDEWWNAYYNGEIAQDIDGYYGVQCMDCANSFGYWVLGVGSSDYAAGDYAFSGPKYAKQVFDYVSTDDWYKIPYSSFSSSPPKLGDVIVFHNGTAGHIAIIKDYNVNTNVATMYEANWDIPNKPSIGTRVLNNYTTGYLKWKHDSPIPPTPPTPIKNKIIRHKLSLIFI